MAKLLPVKTVGTRRYQVLEASPTEIATQYVANSLIKSGYQGVNGSFFNTVTQALAMHYTRGQTKNHTVNHEKNSWTFYISDDERYYGGNLRIACTSALNLTELENKVGKVLFAIGGKDLFGESPRYSGGTIWSTSAFRTLVARGSDDKGNAVIHFIQPLQTVTMATIKEDLNSLGYDPYSTINIDGGGTTQMVFGNYKFLPKPESDGSARPMPYLIKIK
ncbi:phosphodiester glycosidase family protein [Ureibacillus sp. MALMAid1270]|uniref:phosphodiester glycosidase family protein n=1 Tax=Ureibacillus sp. MALMAid1270 TaxID=3411629 RepID=UPI003BA4BA4A